MKNRVAVAAIVLVLVGLAALSALDVRARYHDEEAARAAAAAWLDLVDAGDYAASWAEASEIFRQNLTAEEWADGAADARDRLGEVRSRQTPALTRDLPDAPSGDFVRIRYDTDLAIAGAMAEMVILVREQDGGWRVAGYFFQ